MSNWRKLLLPFSAVYYLITLTRNWLYDQNIWSSTSYALPLICVGNLSTGGTGKTPMTEYLIRLLRDRQLAVLSRGYGRNTKGYQQVNSTRTAQEVGDEPLQYARKFPAIRVAVCEDRRTGISKLRQDHDPELILLDDAFQHRKIQPGFSIVLTKYNELFLDDVVLPAGNLREPRRGVRRADAVVVTKCPLDLPRSEQQRILDRVSDYSGLPVFLSGIEYPEQVTNGKQQLAFSDLPDHFTLVTGIADARPLVRKLKEAGLHFDHWEFPDHHRFRESELQSIRNAPWILTTEKDFMRLESIASDHPSMYYLPMQVRFLQGGATLDSMILDYVKQSLD
ncbi:tetraacyldisaccharide 4'-kinase [Croceiramulus getboli]|nr:tetraacyldisaccharide 4'-kinase [Flavobacteriaceae bacterium YJPT1-3]